MPDFGCLRILQLLAQFIDDHLFGLTLALQSGDFWTETFSLPVFVVSEDLRRMLHDSSLAITTLQDRTDIEVYWFYVPRPRFQPFPRSRSKERLVQPIAEVQKASQ